MIVIYVEYYYGNFFFMVWIAYVLLPILDFLIPLDHFNLSEERVRRYEKDDRFLVPLYVTWFMDFGMYFSLLYRVSTGTAGATLHDLILYAVCAGQIGAVNATVGHELFHRREKIHKITGTLCYFKMIYAHFFIQHLRFHHKFVATPVDPSTALKGESLYYFLFRTIPQGIYGTTLIEDQRVQATGVTSYLGRVLKNRVFLFHLAQIVYLAGVIYFCGMRTFYFHLLYSFTIVMMLEVINYIEHYGLLRNPLEKAADGSVTAWESVSIKHSWNAPQVVTNLLLFKLQRHSDHHANAYKPYQILESYPESPMLPFGYTVSLVISYFPFIWRKVIDPLADAANKSEKMQEEVRKANELWIIGTLVAVSTVLTYICFFVYGFKYQFSPLQ